MYQYSKVQKNPNSGRKSTLRTIRSKWPWVLSFCRRLWSQRGARAGAHDERPAKRTRWATLETKTRNMTSTFSFDKRMLRFGDVKTIVDPCSTGSPLLLCQEHSCFYVSATKKERGLSSTRHWRYHYYCCLWFFRTYWNRYSTRGLEVHHHSKIKRRPYIQKNLSWCGKLFPKQRSLQTCGFACWSHLFSAHCSLILGVARRICLPPIESCFSSLLLDRKLCHPSRLLLFLQVS